MRQIVPASEPLPHLLRAAARRLPFTLLLVAAILAVTMVTGTIQRPITPEQLRLWGFNLDKLRQGDFLPLLLTLFQANQPDAVLLIVAACLLCVGACEYLLGTRRAMVVVLVTHVLSYLGAYLLLWGLAASGSVWATALAHQADAGASAAALGAAGAVLPLLPRRMQRPVFTTLIVCLLGLLALTHRIWDIEHLIAFPAGLLLGAVFLHQDRRPAPQLFALPRLRPGAPGASSRRSPVGPSQRWASPTSCRALSRRNTRACSGSRRGCHSPSPMAAAI